VVSFIIEDEETKRLMDDEGWSVSCTYNYKDTKDSKGQLYHGLKYDFEILDMDFKNLAIVEKPRYQEARELINSLENGGEGSGIEGHTTPQKEIAKPKYKSKVSLIVEKVENMKKNKSKPITIGKLGKYKDLKELGKKAEKVYRQKIQGKNVKREDVGRVDFYGTGIGKTINVSENNPDVLKTIPKIRDIVRKGDLIDGGYEKDRKDKATFVGIEHDVKIKNKIKTALALIRKQPFNINDFYVLYIRNKKKKKK
jgi:hypothetical protein